MKRLKRQDISYLSFEGGGGAGNAYPGAVDALREQGFLDYAGGRAQIPPVASLASTADRSNKGIDWRLKGPLKGVSGASAGAINALFISLGYTPEEITYILAVNDFNTFFDGPPGPGPSPGLRPCVGGFRLEQLPLTARSWNWLTGPYRRLLQTVIPGAATAPDALGQLFGAMFIVAAALPLRLPDALLETIGRDLRQRTAEAAFLSDFGLFPGFTIRRFFARYISLAVERILRDDPGTTLTDHAIPAPVPGTVDATSGGSFIDWDTGQWGRTSEITFRQHERIFGNALVVSGTNLETMKSHFFSAATTPNFPVVDAVRISMSIPYAFKPVQIKTDADLRKVINPSESTADHYLKGVWVDGGLLNNIPVTAFDVVAGGPGHTLGLMVGVDQRVDISSVGGFLAAYASGLLMGTGDSQLSATTGDVDRVIVLGTADPATGKEIGLFDFTLDPQVYARINQQSKDTVEDFLSHRIDG